MDNILTSGKIKEREDEVCRKPSKRKRTTKKTSETNRTENKEGTKGRGLKIQKQGTSRKKPKNVKDVDNHKGEEEIADVEQDIMSDYLKMLRHDRLLRLKTSSSSSSSFTLPSSISSSTSSPFLSTSPSSPPDETSLLFSPAPPPSILSLLHRSQEYTEEVRKMLHTFGDVVTPNSDIVRLLEMMALLFTQKILDEIVRETLSKYRTATTTTTQTNTRTNGKKKGNKKGGKGQSLVAVEKDEEIVGGEKSRKEEEEEEEEEEENREGENGEEGEGEGVEIGGQGQTPKKKQIKKKRERSIDDLLRQKVQLDQLAKPLPQEKRVRMQELVCFLRESKRAEKAHREIQDDAAFDEDLQLFELGKEDKEHVDSLGDSELMSAAAARSREKRLERLGYRDRLTKGMSQAEYYHYAECSKVSFTRPKKVQKFCQWCRLETYPISLSTECVEVLGQLAYEHLEEIVRGSLMLRESREEQVEKEFGKGKSEEGKKELGERKERREDVGMAANVKSALLVEDVEKYLEQEMQRKNNMHIQHAL